MQRFPTGPYLFSTNYAKSCARSSLCLKHDIVHSIIKIFLSKVVIYTYLFHLRTKKKQIHVSLLNVI